MGCLVVCCNQPTDADALEGIDGWIYITTDEELKELMRLSYEENLNKINDENEDFVISEYLDE